MVDPVQYVTSGYTDPELYRLAGQTTSIYGQNIQSAALRELIIRAEEGRLSETTPYLQQQLSIRGIGQEARRLQEQYQPTQEQIRADLQEQQRIEAQQRQYQQEQLSRFQEQQRREQPQTIQTLGTTERPAYSAPMYAEQASPFAGQTPGPSVFGDLSTVYARQTPQIDVMQPGFRVTGTPTRGTSFAPYQFSSTRQVAGETEQFNKLLADFTGATAAEAARQRRGQALYEAQREFRESSVPEQLFKTGATVFTGGGVPLLVSSFGKGVEGSVFGKEIIAGLKEKGYQFEQPLDVAAREYALYRVGAEEAGREGKRFEFIGGQLYESAPGQVAAFTGASYLAGGLIGSAGRLYPLSPLAKTISGVEAGKIGQGVRLFEQGVAQAFPKTTAALSTVGRGFAFVAEKGVVPAVQFAMRPEVFIPGITAFSASEAERQIREQEAQGVRVSPQERAEHVFGAGLQSGLTAAAAYSGFEGGLKAGQGVLVLEKAPAGTYRLGQPVEYQLVPRGVERTQVSVITQAEQTAAAKPAGLSRAGQSIQADAQPAKFKILTKTMYGRPTIVEGVPGEAKLTQTISEYGQSSAVSGTGRGLFVPRGQRIPTAGKEFIEELPSEGGDVFLRISGGPKPVLTGKEQLSFKFDVPKTGAFEKGTLYAEAPVTAQTGGRPSPADVVAVTQKAEFPLSKDLRQFFGIPESAPTGAQVGGRPTGPAFGEGPLYIERQALEKGVAAIRVLPETGAEAVGRQLALAPGVAVGLRRVIPPKPVSVSQAPGFVELQQPEDTAVQVQRPRLAQRQAEAFVRIPAEERVPRGIERAKTLEAEEPKVTASVPPAFKPAPLPIPAPRVLEPSLPKTQPEFGFEPPFRPETPQEPGFVPGEGVFERAPVREIEIPKTRFGDEFGQEPGNLNEELFAFDEIVLPTPPPFFPPTRLGGGGGSAAGGGLGFGFRGAKKPRKTREVLDPFATYLEKTITELRLGRVATSPSLKTAIKYYKASGGRFVPTAEQILESRGKLRVRPFFDFGAKPKKAGKSGKKRKR